MKHDTQILTIADIAIHRLRWAKRLQKENEILEARLDRYNDVLSILDEMIRHEASYADLTKALEQGLGLPKTWEELE